MKVLKELKFTNFVVLLFAGIINAVGVTIFMTPVKLYDSGISGTSMLLAQLTPDYLPLSVFLILLNIPIFLFGLKSRVHHLPFIQYSLLLFILSVHG